jgi:hypothetical protein
MPTTYEPITRTTLATASGEVVISNIPSTYTDLVLVINAGASSAGSGTYMRFNTDTSPSNTNYSGTHIVGTGSSTISNKYLDFNAILPSWYVSEGASIASTTIAHIMDYSNTTTFKTIISRGNRATSDTDPGTVAVASVWRNTSAINIIQLTLSNNYSVGSTFTLYGILKA